MDLRELPTAPHSRHPWEVARARFFSGLIGRRPELARPVRVLDVGAGDGFLARQMLRALPGGSTVVCFDPHYTVEQTVDFTAPADGASIAFVREIPAGQYDLLLFMDVLEHVTDDRRLLDRLVTEHLADQGLVALSVPSGAWLFSQHDVSLGHRRRYAVNDFNRLLASAGLHIESCGSLFHGLLLARAGQKFWEVTRGIRSRPTAGEDAPTSSKPIGVGGWRHGPTLTATVNAALGVETRASMLLARAALKVPGLSLWALCSKR